MKRQNFALATLLIAAGCGGAVSPGATTPLSASCPTAGSTVSANVIGNYELARELNGCDVQVAVEMHSSSWGNFTCVGANTTGGVTLRVRAPGTTPGELDPAILVVADRSIATDLVSAPTGTPLTLRGHVETHAYGAPSTSGCLVFRAQTNVVGQ